MSHRLAAGAIALAAFVVSASAQAPVPPAPGDLVISEIMFNPICAGNQNSAEWFEVTNISRKTLDLNGIYVQDGPSAMSADPTKYFQVLPSNATLPPMAPGRRFVFCRSADPMLNGGLPQVDYAYAMDVNNPDAPADHSKVGFTKQNFSSQSPDGCHIAINAPLGAPGSVLIATISYNPVVYPFQLPYVGGGSAEMIDLYGTCVIDPVTGANSPNMAQALATATFGSCVTGADWGTPGSVNSTDATTWPMYTSINDSLNQNTGILTAENPPSITGEPIVFRLQNGPPTQTYSLGYADGFMEIPFDVFLGGNPGALLLDIVSAQFLYDPSTYLFDAAGVGALPISLPSNPLIVGLSFTTQWIAFDVNTFQFAGSNAVQFTVCP